MEKRSVTFGRRQVRGSFCRDPGEAGLPGCRGGSEEAGEAVGSLGREIRSHRCSGFRRTGFQLASIRSMFAESTEVIIAVYFSA